MRKNARLFSPFARTSAKAVLNEERTLSDAISRTSGAAESKSLCTRSEQCIEPRERQTDTRGLEKLVWPAWLYWRKREGHTAIMAPAEKASVISNGRVPVTISNSVTHADQISVAKDSGVSWVKFSGAE
jgi:hypothetical protein